MYKKYIKRLLDIILSLIAIIVSFPIFLIIGLLVLIFLGKPAIYRQKRPGKNEKIFKLYKFRTMTNKKDKNGKLLPDEQRLTKFGKLLRKTSLDEIPEFLNILKGDMSLIGPRPLLVRYLPYYTDKERHRHDVRPGLTGWAQVNGRNSLSWEDKFKLDLEYVKNVSLKMDIIVMIKTISIVLKHEGITDGKTETMTFLDEERKDKYQKKIIILGASGHAKVIADIIKNSNDNLIGFLDDDKDIQGKVIFEDKKVLGTTQKKDIDKYKDCYFIIGIGSNKVRELISNKYPNLKWYTAIHPKAIIASNVKIGEGTVIMAGVVINPGTTIGKHCIINTCSSLDHDNILKNFVHISPGAHLAGTVTIGEKTWICAGVTVINNISIGNNNIIGAGGTVINNIEDNNCTFVGVPAKKYKKGKRNEENNNFL